MNLDTIAIHTNVPSDEYYKTIKRLHNNICSLCGLSLDNKIIYKKGRDWCEHEYINKVKCPVCKQLTNRFRVQNNKCTH
jgi:hypothetical protein